MSDKFKKYLLPAGIILAAAIAVFAVMLLLRGSGGVPAETDIHGYTIATDENGEYFFYATDEKGNRIIIETGDDGSDVLVYTDETGGVINTAPVETGGDGKIKAPKSAEEIKTSVSGSGADTAAPETTGASDTDSAPVASVPEQTWNPGWDSFSDETSSSVESSSADGVESSAADGSSDTEASSDDPGEVTPESSDTETNEWGDGYYPGWY